MINNLLREFIEEFDRRSKTLIEMDISFIRDQIKNDLDEYYYIKDKPFKRY